MIATTITLTRHQSIAVVQLLVEVHHITDGRALQTRFAKLAGEATTMELTARQVTLLVWVCLTHLELCEKGCMGDEAAAQIITTLTPSPVEAPIFDRAVRARVGRVYRYQMTDVPDMVVRVRSAYPCSRDSYLYSEGECADLDVISGDAGEGSSRMIARSYQLTPIAIP